MPGPRSHPCRVLALSLLAAIGGRAAAQDPPKPPDPALSPEARAALLRATMVLRVAPYIRPTAAPAKPPVQLRIGVVGDDPTGRVLLQQMAGKRFGERELLVIAIPVADAMTPAKTSSIDLLYLATDLAATTVTEITVANATSPLALMTERPGFAAGGGAVQLFVKENFLRFEINNDALKRQGLVADSQLLKLSQRGPR